MNAYLDAEPGRRTSQHSFIIMPTHYDEQYNDMNPGGVPFYGLGINCFALDYAHFDIKHLGQNTREGHLLTKWYGGFAHELGHGLNLPHNLGTVSDNNAHGTGTPLNDVGETLAVKKALGEEQAKHALVSSTKSMTGHMLGAAGAIEAIVCLKTLETGVVAPTLNLKEPDPQCDLNYVPNQAVEATIDIALSNSLGFGGHNACLAFKRVTE